MNAATWKENADQAYPCADMQPPLPRHQRRILQIISLMQEVRQYD